MEQRICQSRENELSNIYKASFLRALNTALSFSTLPLVSLATFGGSWLMGRTLLSEDIFTALAFFVMVRVPVTIAMPTAIEKFSEACVSARRIDQFMKLQTLSKRDEKYEDKNENKILVMENASFSWKDTPSLLHLSLKIRRGTLVGVKKAVGSGKSTLLAAILNEINLIDGKLHLNFQSISYAPQAAWIFPDTIRANILLGVPMDEERYRNVINACCLRTNLQGFGEVGDLLMIGDKGMNLSGGQRARIALARALYADADLYLLDDPLSAVDAKVAKTIFDQCIGPHSLLRGKTRILVTHQTHFLNETDQLFLMTNGHIEELPNERQSVTELFDDQETDWTVNNNVIDKNSIIRNETFVDANVRWNVWFKLFTSPPLGWFGFLLMLIFMIGNELVYDLTNNWLALWSSKDRHEQ